MTQRKPYINWVRRAPSVNGSGFRFSVSRTKRRNRNPAREVWTWPQGAVFSTLKFSAWKNRVRVFPVRFFWCVNYAADFPFKWRGTWNEVEFWPGIGVQFCVKIRHVNPPLDVDSMWKFQRGKTFVWTYPNIPAPPQYNDITVNPLFEIAQFCDHPSIRSCSVFKSFLFFLFASFSFLFLMWLFIKKKKYKKIKKFSTVKLVLSRCRLIPLNAV